MSEPTKHRITNEDIYFMLGQLKAAEASNTDLLKKHIEDTSRRLASLETKTSKLDHVLAFATGVATVAASLLTFFVSKLSGLVSH